MTRKPPRSWFWAPPVEQEVDEELAFHLEMHARDLVAGGMTPEAAREKSLARFGDLYRLRRTCVSLGKKRNRMLNVTRWMSDCRDDVVVALRRLKQSQGFTLVVVLTLALGIGANSALFALADAALLRPLPFPDADRLVMIHEHAATIDRGTVAPFEVAEWVARNRAFESMAAIGFGERAITTGDGTGEQVATQTVSARFFDVFRVRPIAGRTFLPSDDHPNAEAAVLSERFWRTRLGGDPGVVGRQIKIDSEPFTVVGVVPNGFQILNPSDVWTLLATPFMRSPAGFSHYLRVVGRLAPGATLAGAQTDMTAIADAIAAERPNLNKGRGVLLEPLHNGLIRADLRLTAKLLLGVIAFVLLTCCANVANLVLARTAGRTRELAVRSALGAGGRRIARLLLTESLVLSAIAAVLGGALGAAILAAAPALLPQGVLPVDVTLAFEPRVLTFCAITAVGLALAFGGVPAWHALRHPPMQAMTTGGRASTSSGSAFRNILATTQVAAAVVLLCGAGLLLRSLVALSHVDAGYHATEVLTMRIALPFVRPNAPPGKPYATVDARRQFYDAVEREVRSVPGVRNVAWGSALPLDGWWIGMSFQRASDPPRPEPQRDSSRYQHAGPSYFETLGIPILAGRTFTSADTATSPPVCIVTEAFARRYLRDRTPVGARLVVRGMTTGGGPLPVREIVGVVGQVKEQPDEKEAQPQIYVPVSQDPPWQLSLVVQPSDSSAAALTSAVRAAVARVDKERALTKIRTLAVIRDEANAAARFRAVLIGAFAVLVLTLAVVGVFGVLAYSVQQRVREFGIRMALGATTRNVLRLVFASTVRMVATGVLLGLLAAAMLGRSLASFLFGVKAVDPITFISVAALLALTAMLATVVPALRAARVDPIGALRNE
jgi:putative ABC transport system permease protein